MVYLAVVKRFRLLVLASGRGSHAVNLIQATRDGRISGEVARGVSDRPDAAVLTESRALGVPVLALAPVTPRARLAPEAERELPRVARADGAGRGALGGFMRHLT